MNLSVELALTQAAQLAILAHRALAGADPGEGVDKAGALLMLDRVVAHIPLLAADIATPGIVHVEGGAAHGVAPSSISRAHDQRAHDLARLANHANRLVGETAFADVDLGEEIAAIMAETVLVLDGVSFALERRERDTHSPDEPA